MNDFGLEFYTGTEILADDPTKYNNNLQKIINALNGYSGGDSVDLSNFVTKTELQAVESKIPTAEGLATEGLATENFVTNAIALAQIGGSGDVDLSNYATKDEIPTRLGELENDCNFITTEDVPTKVSELENDCNFITTEDVPTKVSELENDCNFITTEDVPTKVSELENDCNFITTEDVPTKVSELENDCNFITTEDVPTKVSELENDCNFITTEDVPTKVSELENDAGYITSGDPPEPSYEYSCDFTPFTYEDISVDPSTGFALFVYGSKGDVLLGVPSGQCIDIATATQSAYDYLLLNIESVEYIEMFFQEHDTLTWHVTKTQI